MEIDGRLYKGLRMAGLSLSAVAEMLDHLDAVCDLLTSGGRYKDLADLPTVICLCGSTRFYKEYQRVYFEQTLAGKIVLSVGFYPHASEEVHGQNIGISEVQKAQLDELHLRKIDLADEVLFLNVGGYLGESSRRELAYAREKGKVIKFLEATNDLFPGEEKA